VGATDLVDAVSDSRVDFVYARSRVLYSDVIRSGRGGGAKYIIPEILTHATDAKYYITIIQEQGNPVKIGSGPATVNPIPASVLRIMDRRNITPLS
jgi:hypothetical protein